MSRFVRNMKGGNACVIAALCVCVEGQRVRCPFS